MTDLRALFADDPFAAYYNLDGLTDVCLTCDVDWAPEYAIEKVLKTVESFGFKFTIFSTHDSALLQNAPSWCEVGLHPDFTRRNPPFLEERMATLKALYPNAKGTRSHRNVFGQNIADIAYQHGLLYDSSSILWNQTLAQAHIDYNGMTRFSYMWEDGLHLDYGFGLDIDGINLQSPGLKILNVHPVLQYLNSPLDSHRRSVTRRYSDLANAPKHELDADIHAGRGIYDVWMDLLRLLAERNVRTHMLGDIAIKGVRTVS